MYLFVDTETGGIGLDKSLLTVGFLVVDDDLEIKYNLLYKVKPKDGVYNITAEALSINKINLIEHDKEAITYEEAGSQLYEMLSAWGNDGKNKLIVVGKNVSFDLQQIWDKLLRRKSWEHFCSYRVIDITSIQMVLISLGQITPTVGSLADLCQHYHIPVVDSHTADGDCLLTLECYKAMYLIIRAGISALDYKNKMIDEGCPNLTAE